MLRRRVRTPLEQLHPFERSHIVGLQEAGWALSTDCSHVGHRVSVVCRCIQQWSVEYIHAHRLGSGRQHSTDAWQGRSIMRAAVATRTASREEIRAHVASAVSPRTTGTFC